MKNTLLTLFALTLAFFGGTSKAEAQSPCGVTAYFTVAVNCRTVTFTNMSSGTDSTTMYQWSFGNGAGSNIKNPTHTYNASGTYTVCLVVKKILSNNSFCVDTFCKAVVIPTSNCCPNIQANFTFQINCTDRTVAFMGTATGDSALSYKWIFGDNTTGTGSNATKTYANPGVYTVCFVAYKYINSNTPCADTVCKTITIPTNCCNINTNWNYNIDCVNRKIIVNSLNNDSSANYAYLWKFGNGTTATTKVADRIYATPGTYNVCLVISKLTPNGSVICKDSLCKTIVIPTNCCNVNAQFSTTVICDARKVYVSASADSTVSYTWKWGDGTTGSGSPAFHVYTTPGTYTICLKAVKNNSNGSCADSVCKTIVIPQNCCSVNPNFSFQISCANKKLYLTANQYDSNATYIWKWGDGSTTNGGSPVFHQYNAPGVYNVCVKVVKVANGVTCMDSSCKTITIPPNCCNTNANWGYTLNCSAKKIIVEAPMDSGATYQWIWGDNTTNGSTRIADHTYSTPGIKTVCLVVTKQNGTNTPCRDTVCKQINIPQSCCTVQARFAVQLRCNLAYFVNTSTGGGTSYFWSFGDSTFTYMKTPLHIYRKTGPYNVCLTVYDSVQKCSSTVCKRIVVRCKIPGTFEATLDNSRASEKAINIGDGEVEEELNLNFDGVLKVYPNPANSAAWLQLPSDEPTEIRIINMAGQEVFSTQVKDTYTYPLNLENLAKGVYMVTSLNNNTSQTVRLVIQ